MAQPSPITARCDACANGLDFESWASGAAGFAGNAAVAKYAQMTTDASMSDFIAPMVLGGLVAGATAGVIGWGAAKLREA